MHRREKLTKKLLLSLETGMIIVSNVLKEEDDGTYQSELTTIVPDHGDRISLWKEIKLKNTDGRLCNIFESSEEYEQYVKEHQEIFSKRKDR